MNSRRTETAKKRSLRTGWPPPQGLYDPRFEHESCGVGFVVSVKGRRSHDIIRQALQIPADLYLYPQGYLIAIVDAPTPVTEAKYFVGKRTILGMFPAAGNKVYLFYMIDTGSYDRVKSQGLPALQQAWTAIDPSNEMLFRALTDWSQTAFMPTGRVRTPTWVADGAVLIGDAAHAMNPHASQGRMQAMVDAMTLADLLPECLASHDYSAERLKRFEYRWPLARRLPPT